MAADQPVREAETPQPDRVVLTYQGDRLGWQPTAYFGGCPGHGRHWYTVRGHVGVRSPKCIRCGFPNPTPLTTDDWQQVLEYAPHLLNDPEATREALEDECERGETP